MQENGLSLTHIFSYENRIVDSLLIQENVGKQKPAFSRILGRENHKNDRVFPAIGSGF